MQDKLELQQGENLHLFTKSGGHINAMGMSVDGDKAVGLFSSAEKGPGTVFLYWDGKNRTYRSHPTGYKIRVERPAFARATLIRNTTSDGIMEIEAPVDKRYKLDMISIEDQDWGHIKHPGKTWTRRSGVFTAEEGGDAGVLPLELFGIEVN